MQRRGTMLILTGFRSRLGATRSAVGVPPHEDVALGPLELRGSKRALEALEGVGRAGGALSRSAP